MVVAAVPAVLPHFLFLGCFAFIYLFIVSFITLNFCFVSITKTIDKHQLT